MPRCLFLFGTKIVTAMNGLEKKCGFKKMCYLLIKVLFLIIRDGCSLRNGIRGYKCISTNGDSSLTSLYL